jgi:hypothetical protein
MRFSCGLKYPSSDSFLVGNGFLLNYVRLLFVNTLGRQISGTRRLSCEKLISSRIGVSGFLCKLMSVLFGAIMNVGVRRVARWYI